MAFLVPLTKLTPYSGLKILLWIVGTNGSLHYFFPQLSVFIHLFVSIIIYVITNRFTYEYKLIGMYDNMLQIDDTINKLMNDDINKVSYEILLHNNDINNKYNEIDNICIKELVKIYCNLKNLKDRITEWKDFYNNMPVKYYNKNLNLNFNTPQFDVIIKDIPVLLEYIEDKPKWRTYYLIHLAEYIIVLEKQNNKEIKETKDYAFANLVTPSIRV